MEEKMKARKEVEITEKELQKKRRKGKKRGE